MGFFITYWIVSLVMSLFLMLAGPIYEKAGVGKAKAMIPFMNFYHGLEISGKPKWHFALIFIPVVNFFAFIAMYVDFAKSFGKNRTIDHAMAMLIPPVFLYMLGKDQKATFKGKAKELPKIKKTWLREWQDAILFAVYAATLVRWATFEAFMIPTSSMEKSLLVGDYLFVSKIHYGSRTPQTPLQIPFTHQKIEFLGIDKTWSELIQLPMWRLPGITEVKRGDAVVFNAPREGGEGNYPIDLKTNYVKRCVGMPGDKLEVRDKQLYINDKPLENPENMQFSYEVIANQPITHEFLKRKYDITYDHTRPEMNYNGNLIIHVSKKLKAQIERNPAIKELKLISYSAGEAEDFIFPRNPEMFKWNRDFYGPIIIPKKGMKVKLDAKNIELYRDILLEYDQNENVDIDGANVTINGEKVTEYTFKQDYFFMMGDNRHGSFDSRYWGFVGERNIVGKAALIWFSSDKYKKFPENVRWDRLFKLVD